MSQGHIRRRGTHSWEIKFDLGTDPKTGKRLTRYHSFKGTRREAQARLIGLLATVGQGAYVEPNKTTVTDFVRTRVDQWEAAGDISARTAQRYRQLVENQIAPFIGSQMLQKLRPLDVEQWHTALRTSGKVRGEGGVAARTIGHAHRVLSKALRDAVKNGIVMRNVAAAEGVPKVVDGDMVIVRDVPGLLAKLRGWRLGTAAIVALFTGMRLGEVLALRWNRIDVDTKTIQVREALEQTTAHGIRFKPPKSKAGIRNVSIPDALADTLREHRRAVVERQMKLGAGRLAEDALVFATLEGEPLSPNAVSAAWADFHPGPKMCSPSACDVQDVSCGARLQLVGQLSKQHSVATDNQAAKTPRHGA
jgi:integrase